MIKRLTYVAVLAVLALSVSAFTFKEPNWFFPCPFWWGIDVCVYDGNNLRQYDHLLYIQRDNDVFASRFVLDPRLIVLSLQGDVIFSSRTHINSNRLYKIVGNHIMPPESTNIADALYSFEGDAFFRGPQTNDNSKRLFTRRGFRIYSGTSNSLDDVVITFEGDFDKLRPFLPILADLRPMPDSPSPPPPTLRP